VVGDFIVWAVNPRNDSLSRFVPYIRECLQSLLETTSIRFHVDVPTDLPDMPLSSEVRHHLYMVIREALNNVVKHSAATEVKFCLRIEGPGLVILIEDNGKGFVQQDTSLFGNGLQNMNTRIRSLGGSIDIQTQPGKGTCLKISLPLKCQ
jgi:signal transduction histidine kinase